MQVCNSHRWGIDSKHTTPLCTVTSKSISRREWANGWLVSGWIHGWIGMDRPVIFYRFTCAVSPAYISLQWRHNGCDGVSNHQPHHCLLNSLFRRRSKKISKLRVTGLCEWNSSVTGEFAAQRASNAEMFPFDDVIMHVTPTRSPLYLQTPQHQQTQCKLPIRCFLSSVPVYHWVCTVSSDPRFWSHDAIQNGRRDLEKSRRTWES